MKKDYMTRLERWARWMLPRQEVEDVLADYRDIVADPELARDLGKPRTVIRALADRKSYYTWLAAFAVMALCILIPGVSPLPDGPYPVWFSMFSSSIPGLHFCRLFLIAGTAMALVWFRPGQEEARTPLPRAILLWLAVLLAVMGVMWWISWQLILFPEGVLADPAWYPPADFVWPAASGYEGGHLLALLLEWGAVPLVILGITALVKARTRDRRWRAVYVFSLSAMMLAFCVLATFSSMDPTLTLASLFFPLPYSVEITLIGLAGTGVALC